MATYKIAHKRYYWLVPAIIIIDQIFKYLVRISNIDYNVVNNFLSITFISNTGAGFGILQEHRVMLLLFNIIFLALIIFIFFKYPKTKLASISFILIISGAIGNLIDRIFIGYVTDFINFNFWPAFNVADMAITIGALILAYCIITGRDGSFS